MTQCVRHSPIYLFLRNIGCCRVDEGAQRGRHRPSAPDLTLAEAYLTPMQGDQVIARTETGRDCQVDLDRVNIGKPVNRQSRVVGDDPLTAAPQRPPDEVILRAVWPLRQSKKSPINPKPVACVGVIFLGLVGVTDVECLGGREVAGLLERQCMECSAMVLARCRHAGSMP